MPAVADSTAAKLTDADVIPNNGELYQPSNLRRPINVADIGREGTAIYHNFGDDLNRRGNLAFIEQNLLIYVGGNAVIFEDLTKSQKEYLLCVDDGGIGCVAIHPSKRLFAVGGKGFQPNIYVYSYPEKQILNVLKGGAEQGYASITFNKKGDKLASVSMSPDFMLTVWDWQMERVGLHSKAFGQDVFSVRFSPDDERRLTTCGTGHIRFWKLADTFTGLKLQGSIGKFGKVELSDIAAFVECPDGKVVSGTESGSLLLWEGNFIKCRFIRMGGLGCHEGEITYVDLDREENRLITASMDGFIRWWNFEVINDAEVDSDVSIDFELKVMAEYCIGEGRGIKMMVDSGVVEEGRTFYVVDSKGCSMSIHFWLGEEPEEVMKPGMVKRRSIKDIIVDKPVKRIRRISLVIENMKPAFRNIPLPPELIMEDLNAGISADEDDGEDGKKDEESIETRKSLESKKSLEMSAEGTADTETVASGEKSVTFDESEEGSKAGSKSEITVSTSVKNIDVEKLEIEVDNVSLNASSFDRRSILRSPAGKVYADRPVTTLFSDSHAGAITGMDSSPTEHLVVTGGVDGSLRCWDYIKKSLLFVQRFGAPVTVLKWVPLAVDPSGRSIAVGFADGIIRVLKIIEYDIGQGYKNFRRRMVFKPHNASVIDVAFSELSPLFTSCGADGTVFFFDTRSAFARNKQFIPLKFIRFSPVIDLQGKSLPPPLPGQFPGQVSVILCEKLIWRISGREDSLACVCSDGVLREVG